MTNTSQLSTQSEPPGAGSSRYMRIACLAAGVLLLDGYILGVLSPIMANISADLSMSVLMQGLIGSASLIGLLVGAPLGGWLSDRFGRRKIFTLNISVTLVASLLILITGAAWQLLVLRLIMGIAIGSDYSVVKPMLAEFAPPRIRGRLLAIGEMSWYVGFMIAFVVGYVLSNSFDAGWRMIAASSAVLAVVLLLLRIGMPESPLWLISQGRRNEAELIAQKYLEKPAESLNKTTLPIRQGSFKQLFSRDFRKLTAYTAIFFFCAVTPYFSIAIREVYHLVKTDPRTGEIAS